MLDLSSTYNLTLGTGVKGLPCDVQEIRLGDVGKAGWRLHDDLQLPAAVVRRAALENNARWMMDFVKQFEVQLCPHGKTTMSPQLFDRQLRDGAWGLTCATIGHLRLYRSFGVSRVIFANQICGRSSALWLARELAADPSFDIHVFVDSLDGACLLADAAAAVGLRRPIGILLEVGVAGARTGVRAFDDAVGLARQIASLPQLALTGVATFEGVVSGADDTAIEAGVTALFAQTVHVAETCAKERLFSGHGPIILSAGGSKYFDLAALQLKAADLGGREGLVILRSGCYISHDANQYQKAFERLLERSISTRIEGRLVNALEVWAEVQSRPDPDWLYANLGKRDISHDIDLPQVISAYGSVSSSLLSQMTVRKLSDQHAHVQIDPSVKIGLGDHLAFGVSHPCTTFDKWRILFEVDSSDRVVDAIATFF